MKYQPPDESSGDCMAVAGCCEIRHSKPITEKRCNRTQQISVTTLSVVCGSAFLL
jgi:hypothetical protein